MIGGRTEHAQFRSHARHSRALQPGHSVCDFSGSRSELLMFPGANARYSCCRNASNNTHLMEMYYAHAR